MAMVLEKSEGINNRSKSEFGNTMYWIVNTDGKKVTIYLNYGTNHFGRKHLLLPVAEGRESTPKPVLEEAVKKRAKSRDVAHDRDAGLHNKMTTTKLDMKYGYWSRVGYDSTVLNLRPNDGVKGINEKTAAVAFAKALLAAKSDQEEITIDFGHECVYTTKSSDQARTVSQSKMKVSFWRLKGEGCFEIYHCAGGVK